MGDKSGGLCHSELQVRLVLGKRGSGACRLCQVTVETMGSYWNRGQQVKERYVWKRALHRSKIGLWIAWKSMCIREEKGRTVSNGCFKKRENGRSIKTILCVPCVSVHCLRFESGVFRQLWIDFQCYFMEKESSNQSPQHWLIHVQVYGCLSIYCIKHPFLELWTCRQHLQQCDICMKMIQNFLKQAEWWSSSALFSSVSAQLT